MADDNVRELFPESDEAEDREARAAFDLSFDTERGRALVDQLVKETRTAFQALFFADKVKAVFRAGFRCGYIAARTRYGKHG